MKKKQGIYLSLTPASITYSNRTLYLCFDWSSSLSVPRSKFKLNLRLIGMIQLLTCNISQVWIKLWRYLFLHCRPKNWVAQGKYLISCSIQTDCQSTIGLAKKPLKLGHKPTSRNGDLSRTKMKPLFIYQYVCSFQDILNVVKRFSHSLEWVICQDLLIANTDCLV